MAGGLPTGPSTARPPGRRRGRDVLMWTDRVYGRVEIDDPGLLALVRCPTYRRLKGVRQAGPSALAFPFKRVTRYEHSLGVFELLRRLGAGRKEQVAGLLHDISHTAFSHAIDFVIESEEQAHHEEIKHLFLGREDLAAAIEGCGFRAADFLDDSAFPLLERPIPWLCADRLDYFFRDGLACGLCRPDQVRSMLDSLVVVDGTIAFGDEAMALEARRLFAIMNRDWWASDTEAYIYNEFGRMLRQAIDEGAINFDDLLTEDEPVLAKIRANGSSAVMARLRDVEHFDPSRLVGYVAAITPKNRWLDPPVLVDGRAVPIGRLTEPPETV